MEIKVGEYVRTKKGKIFKYGKGRTYLGKDNEILNHSFNIKELIEEGDIVNGFTIEEFDDEEGNIYLGIAIYNDAQLDWIEEVRPIETIKIKTILTHEQYERNSYRLEEE